MQAGPGAPAPSQACLAEQLEQGLHALGLEAQIAAGESYLRYLALLSKWNRTYNLTAVRDPQRMLRAHVLDSLAALPHIKGDNCLDAGSGAGLPGFILALAQPARRWTLLDSNTRKVRFLRHLVYEIKPENVRVAHARVEEFLSSEPYSSIIARAFAPLDKFYRAVEHLIAPQTRVIAMKGKINAAELRAARAAGRHIRIQPLTVPGLDATRNLIIREQ